MPSNPKYLVHKVGDDEQHFYVGGVVAHATIGAGNEWHIEALVEPEGVDPTVYCRYGETGTYGSFKLDELRVIEIPDEIRSESSNCGYIAPYHVRDFMDDPYHNTYWTFEEAAHYARYLADGEDQPMHVCNAYSNSVESFEPSTEEELENV